MGIKGHSLAKFDPKHPRHAVCSCGISAEIIAPIDLSPFDARKLQREWHDKHKTWVLWYAEELDEDELMRDQ